MSKTKLRPCPFCECNVVETVKIGPRSWVAECDWCEARTGPRGTKQAAIISWNERERRDLNGQIWCLVEIRRIVGDPEGKLMQNELVECIAKLVADAALGRAVRKMPDMAKLWHAEVRWYLHPGDGPCLPLGTGNTPEAALAAAGLMEEEGEVT